MVFNHLKRFILLVVSVRLVVSLFFFDNIPHSLHHSFDVFHDSFNILHATNPQVAYFGDNHTYVRVRRVSGARILLVNPIFFGVDFGVFKIPTSREYFASMGSSAELEILNKWGVAMFGDVGNGKMAFVPHETGRSLLLPPSIHPMYSDILIKGIGPVTKFTEGNKLRFSHLGFDGFFEIAEGTKDLVIAEILGYFGAKVARGLGVVDFNVMGKRGKNHIRAGAYIRAFEVQTRISNLVELTPAQRKRAVDDAMIQLRTIYGDIAPKTYTEYFYFIASILAKTAAVYQALGFTQQDLHFGQVTLAGEITDLGNGTWEESDLEFRHKWFRHERQPMLLQNMLLKTHSVKSEPDPIHLRVDSKTVAKQHSLWGFIKSFAPNEAREIVRSNPVNYFWSIYKSEYISLAQRFPFLNNPKDPSHPIRMIRHFYHVPVSSLLPSDWNQETKQRVLRDYFIVKKRLTENLDRSTRPKPDGLTSLQRISILSQIAHKMGVPFNAQQVFQDWMNRTTIFHPMDEQLRMIMFTNIRDKSWVPERLIPWLEPRKDNTNEDNKSNSGGCSGLRSNKKS